MGSVGALVNYDIALGKSPSSTNFSSRQMVSGASLLNYDFYTSSAYSSIWGDGTGGSQKVSGTLSILVIGGTSKQLIVYGRIPGSQSAVRTGSYSDAVVVTVTYN